MCGIVGYISRDNKEHDIFEMLNFISHRGPDDFGVYRNNNVALGHQRLSIQDLSENGHQPMFSEDNNFIIIYNGEIYNHWDLREDLEKNIILNQNQTLRLFYMVILNMVLKFLTC